LLSLRDRLFIFIDDNLCFDKEYSLELLRIISPLRKRWVCQVTLNVAEDDRLLRAMRKAGCVGVLIGIESLNENNIAFIGKRNNVVGGNTREKSGVFIKQGFLCKAVCFLALTTMMPVALSRVLEFRLLDQTGIRKFLRSDASIREPHFESLM